MDLTKVTQYEEVQIVVTIDFKVDLSWKCIMNIETFEQQKTGEILSTEREP